eukprot:Clim_evm1s106 gene=Clim_evmTU1s106
MEVYEAVGLGNAQAEIVAPVHGRRQVNLDFADEDSYEQPLAEIPAQGGLSSLDLPIEARVNSHRLKTKRQEMPSGWTDLGENLAEDLITVHMSVGEAKKAFTAKFNYYLPPNNQDSRIIRTLEYHVPDEVSAALLDVSGLMLVGYTPFKAQLSKAGDSRRRFSGTPSSSNPITPAAILSEYQITPSAPQVSTQAVASFFDGQNEEYFSPADLAQFQSKFDVTSNAIKKVIGPTNNSASPQYEANLDTQYITSSCKGCATWVFYQEDFFNLASWVATVLETDNAPHVLSMSYGFSEESGYWENMDSANVQFMKLGTTGRTLLVASGDSGVGCSGGANDPGFPASSPYVTAVGGTDGASKGWAHSGGGFSNQFARMHYQNDQVTAYLDSSISFPPSNQFNTTGRAFPDISGFSTYYEIIYEGSPVLLDGTSCSTPTVAGIVTLLNDVSIANGGSTLGFLNPLLYQMAVDKPQAFTDIVSGKNPDSPCSGFNAAPGWDPVTGLGTPNFPAMSAYVASIAQSSTASSRRSADLSF